MDQHDLIDALARDENVNLSRRKIKKSVAVIFEEITEALARGQRVEIAGIGVLSTCTLGRRWGRDPVTGQTVMRPKTTNPTFRADKKLTAHLNKHELLKSKKAAPLPRKGLFLCLREGSSLFRLVRRLESYPPDPSPH